MLQKFIARQPIFDSKENVYGCELLFRSGLGNFFSCENSDHAASAVIVDSFPLFGIDTLTAGRYAFLNFTDDLILRQFATLPATEKGNRSRISHNASLLDIPEKALATAHLGAIEWGNGILKFEKEARVRKTVNL